MFDKLQSELMSDVMEKGSKGIADHLILYFSTGNTCRFNDVISVKYVERDTETLLVIGFKDETTGEECKAIFDEAFVVGVAYAV